MFKGQEAVSSVFGPLSISIDGLSLFVKAVLDARPWDHDPMGVRMPWRQDEYQLVNHGGGKKLCYAILWDDGFVKPMQPYKRAMQMLKDALLAAGHEVIDWEPYKHEEAWDLLKAIWAADGGKDVAAARALSGEPSIEGIFVGETEIGTYDYWQLLKQRLRYTKATLEHWNATVSRTSTGRPVDAIIAPGNSNAPHPHGVRFFFLSRCYEPILIADLPWQVPQSVMYTAWGNLNDFASGVLPVTTVDQKLDAVPSPHQFHNSSDEAVFKACQHLFFLSLL